MATPSMTSSNAGRWRSNCCDERLQPLSLRRLGGTVPVAPRELITPRIHRFSCSLSLPLPCPSCPSCPSCPARWRFVDRIVHCAAEVPDGDDRAPLVRRQDEKRIVEAGLAGHQRAPRSHRAARHSSRARRRRRARADDRAASRAALDPFENAGAAEPGEAQLEPQPAVSRRRRRAVPLEIARVSRPRTLPAPRPTPASAGRAPSRIPVAPQACCTSRGTYSRPARQSRPKSCQKFVSCSAVHNASDDRSRASSR